MKLKIEIEEAEEIKKLIQENNVLKSELDKALQKLALHTPSETSSKIVKMIEEIKKRKAKTQAQEEILNFIPAKEYDEPRQVFDDKQNLIGWKVEKKEGKEEKSIPLISEEDVKKE